MGIKKPYYRIIRPEEYASDYVEDLRYASDRLQLGSAYLSIERKLSLNYS